MACTLLARWDSGYQEPWLVLTDLSPQRADALWYGLRPSTECVYRDLKSDGWQWQNTRLLDPERAERLWLAMAVATLWMVMLGGEAENQSPQTQFRATSQKTYCLKEKFSTSNPYVGFLVFFWVLLP